MNLRKRTLMAISIMVVMSIPLVPSYVLGWKADSSEYYTTYNTHQWLSWEAVEMFPEAQVTWITNNLQAFWYGVEAAFDGETATLLGLNASHYGKVELGVILLDDTGTTVENDTLADYADDEYDKLVIELVKNDTDYELAAFYAGAMSHYIAQAGYYKAIWDDSIWGTLNTTEAGIFQNKIENGITETRYETPVFNYNFEDLSAYYHDFFTLSPTAIANAEAYNATIDLAKNIHPYAEDLAADINITVSDASEWETTYANNVEFCLTASVEAIYAALSNAMDDANWRYISLPDPVFTFNDVNFHIEIDEFEVLWYDDEMNSYVLNDSLATLAEAYYVYLDGSTPESMSLEKFDLDYNGTSEKWYLEETLATYTTAQTNHTILYHFDMDLAAPTWSNVSDNFFYIDFYNATIDNIDYRYDTDDRTLTIENVTGFCDELPEIGVIEDVDVYTAEWILYQKGSGATQTGEIFGVPVIDTIGRTVKGNLTFDDLTDSWYSLDNDIGLVFSPTGVELYVVCRFTLVIPVGFYKISQVGGGQPIFNPYVQNETAKIFRTRDHQITISQPIIEFDEELFTISAYNISAYSDYNNTKLDYYEIIEKEIYGENIRDRRWKVFLWDGLASNVKGLLQWDIFNEYWYLEDVDVSPLPDNDYYLSAKIVNMNANFSTSPWGPASALFTIRRPIPVVYFILPELFLAGFVVLFGWLAWYRPRMKRKRLEAEREAKLDKVYD